MRSVLLVLGVLVFAAPCGVAGQDAPVPADPFPSEIAALVADFHAKAAEAAALRNQAEAGDTDALRVAVAAYRDAQALMPPEIGTVEREAFVDRFAEALGALGLATYDAALVGEAVGLLEMIVGDERKARDPAAWAGVQVALGNTYWAWAAWDNDTGRAALALAAFDAALTVFSRDRDALAWARVQNAIGAVYTLLAATDDGISAIEAAIDAFRAALTVIAREDRPDEWSATTSNLAGALGLFARRTGDVPTYQQALALLRDAHGVYSREDDPAGWGSSLIGIAQAAAGLAEMTGDPQALRVSADAYDEALTAMSLQSDGVAWAQALNSQGLVLIGLGELTASVDAYDRAVMALRHSLDFWTADADPDSFGTINWLIGDAAFAGGQIAGDAVRLREAAGAYAAAQSVTPHDASGQWTYLGFLQATALVDAAAFDSAPTELASAREGLAVALTEFQSLSMPVEAAAVAQSICVASARLGEMTGDAAAFEQAIADCRQAEELLRQQGAEDAALEAGARREAAAAALAAIAPAVG